MSGLRTRIAPTPSGFLHAGNALNFLIAHQLAREEAGTVLLRIDDLDTDRVRPEYIEDIFDFLHWLGISWDEGPRDADDFHRNWSQRARLNAAKAMLVTLRSSGHLYACDCSRKIIQSCACRDRSIPLEAPDVCWRLRVPDPCKVRSNKWPFGEDTIDLHRDLPDPVLRQRNGSPSYQLASLADDAHFGTTLIVRGEDLLPSTACQTYLAGLLGLPSFFGARFIHHALVVDAHGRKLSKSAGADSLRAMRAAGASPDPLRAEAKRLLASLRAQGV